MHQLPGAQGTPYGLVSATLEPARYVHLKTALAVQEASVMPDVIRHPAGSDTESQFALALRYWDSRGMGAYGGKEGLP